MSSVRSTQGLRRIPILIGLAAVAVAGLLPGAAGAGAPQGHHLEFRLSGARHQDMVGEGAIVVRARCLSEACTVVASARSKGPALHTGTARVRIAAGEAKALSLPLPKRQVGKLKAALESGRHPVFTIEATAHDQAGTHIPLSLEVQAQRS